jgi:hypothetical protein
MDHQHEEYKLRSVHIFDIFSRLLSRAGKYDDPEYEYYPDPDFLDISGCDPMKIEATIKLSPPEIKDIERIVDWLDRFAVDPFNWASFHMLKQD